MEVRANASVSLALRRRRPHACLETGRPLGTREPRDPVTVEAARPRTAGRRRRAIRPRCTGGESYSGVVLTKQPNEGQGGPQEVVEGKPLTEENMEEPNSSRTQRRENESTGLDRVRPAAQQDQGLRFTALLHHVNLERLGSSYHSLRKRAAAGVDGRTWEE